MRCWMVQVALLSVIVRCFGASPVEATESAPVAYATLDYHGPGAVNTFLTGIRGDYIVGLYMTSSNVSRGLIYHVPTQIWKQLDVVVNGIPAASTSPYGPDPVTGGLHVVGSYKLSGSSLDHGFYYDSTKPVNSAFVYLDYPSTPQSTTLNTIPHSMYGNRIVGNYDTSLKSGNAFVYDILTMKYTNINKPDDSRFNPTLSTTAYGIWDHFVAGSYTNLTGTHAYLHDLSTGRFTTYNRLGALVTHFDGITGNDTGAFNYTGDYLAGRTLTAFFFDGKCYTTLKYPGSVTTSGNSVYERTVVGVYTDTAGIVHGYVAEVQQPGCVPFTLDWILQLLRDAFDRIIAKLCHIL